jgi:guanylate kinase
MSIVFIISAPSGSGKSTLVNEVRRVVPGLEFSVSYTTRPPRGSEQNGREYYFVGRADFIDMQRRDELLEWAEVFGHYYGTARRFLREAELKGHDLVLDIDVQGAKQIRGKLPEAVSIFILPPDRKTLEWRLTNRGLDTDGVISRRLEEARREIENYCEYDYILINDQLEESIEKLKAIVVAVRLTRAGRPLSPEDVQLVEKAERCRLSNARKRIRPILDSFGAPVVPE